MENTKQKPNIPFACWGLWLLLLTVGGFHTAFNCGISLVFLGYFFFSQKANTSQPFRVSWGGVFATLLAVFYLLSCLWGVEKGSSLLGFFNFLPLPLYLLIAVKEQGQKKALETLPYALGVGTLLSLLGMVLPVLSEYFTVAGRLGGFLQYPNTFGLLLLVGELLLLTKDKWNRWDFATLALLILGIFLTGSRTVFVLFLVGNVGALFFIKNKKIRWGLLATLPPGIGIAVLLCALTGNLDVITRYLSLSVLESTFVGRILYAYDALPVVLSHPLGLGYMGYAYLQPSFQTGVYSVLYAHNDFLQILLDVGWLPFLFLAFVMGKALFSRDVPREHKWIFLVMTAHALLDFDFQYVGVLGVYLLFTPALNKPVAIKRPVWGKVLAGCLVPLCLYFGTALTIGFFGGGDVSYQMLPFTTKGALATVGQDATVEQKQQIGEQIILHNPHSYLGYQLVGNCAFSQGDFGKMMEYQTKSLELAPLVTEQYSDYAYRLAQGVVLYRQAGDKNSAGVCLAQLQALPEYVKTAQETVSGLGGRIADAPNFTQINTYITQLISHLE